MLAVEYNIKTCAKPGTVMRIRNHSTGGGRGKRMLTLRLALGAHQDFHGFMEDLVGEPWTGVPRG